jgi:hypothetical protein
MPCAWHAEWQSHFTDREVNFPLRPGGHKARRADAIVRCGQDVIVVEVQHSPNTKQEFDERRHDYLTCHGVADLVWIVDGVHHVRHLTISGTCLLVFEEDSAWKYKNFVGYDAIYVECEVGGRSTIFRVRPAAVRSHMVHVPHGVPKAEFVSALKAGAHKDGD